MKNILNTAKKIHCVGIGGIGISALAGILASQGVTISGSDQETSKLTNKLEEYGIEVFEGHKASNLDRNIDLIIHSLAIPTTNPELAEAKRLKIPTLTYPEALGELTKNFYTIAICGTHGKSTTTALIAKTLIENNFDPTVIVGTKISELDGQNFRIGQSKILVVEACEYRRAFLNYSPKVIVMHTIEPDHMDYFKDFDDYALAFEQFAQKLPHDGYFFGNLDEEKVQQIIQTRLAKNFPPYNIFTYSKNYSRGDFFINGNEIHHKDKLLGKLNMKIPGAHNRINALAAFAVCKTLGAPTKGIIHSLNNYKGAFRRFEIKGKIGKTTIIDDYAHHPTEIIATLAGAREVFPKKKICVVFQPHQYSRTKKLLDGFAKAFSDADMVIIPNIYEVRDSEEDKKGITAEHLVNELKKNHQNVLFGDGFEKTVEYLKKNSNKFDVIFTMGAGDVWKIGEQLTPKHKARE